MAYGSETGVEALVPAAGVIGVSSLPTTAQLADWIEEGAGRIDRVILSAGYSAPVASGTLLYPELRALNNLYAGAYVLRARGLDTIAGTEQNKTQQWLAEFDRTLANLASSDLFAMGATLLVSTSTRRSRLRSLQTRRVDGYSAASETAESLYDYPSN